MRLVLLVLTSLVSLSLAQRGYLSNLPRTYASLTSEASVGPDGTVFETPEVAVATAQHAVAHVNERIRLADEIAKSQGGVDEFQAVLLQPLPSSLIPRRILTNYLSPRVQVGADGRIVDTLEVAVAKAAHAAAHAKERINLANEAAKSEVDPTTSDPPYSTENMEPSTTVRMPGMVSVGPDGRILDTPEVASAKAAHAAAYANEMSNLAKEAAKSDDLGGFSDEPPFAYGRFLY